ncbi:hypothetical protein VSR01_16315 [Actinacidiphila sp. DG2A-62]|uniref:hypothetical protein n=1 Tax=Actinacidiphila sp. DG2A-62 TaxID=3108821 RepID=UPI002DB86D86|nr:hypothetical protein [Actinacidiphila sp. DG2A-62]MEC3995010.1 hypothetical protein [Actinacidiphila sp. DG2A-62]
MDGPTPMDIARRTSGGYGTGEGHVGLVDRTDPDETAPPCAMCPGDAVLYFVETAEENQTFACLAHAGAIAYSVAVASTADPTVPASERGADDRRWRKPA